MCGTSNNEEEEPSKEEESESKDYIPKPFPKHEFVPIEWDDVLATLDVCTNEVTPNISCDEMGHDLFSF